MARVCPVKRWEDSQGGVDRKEKDGQRSSLEVGKIAKGWWEMVKAGLV